MLRLWDELSLDRLLHRYPRHRGNRAIRAALHQRRRGSRSPRASLEETFLRLIDAAGIPRPEINALVEDFEVDAVWRDARLVVEPDGRDVLGTAAAFETDRERDPGSAGRRLAAWVRITHRQLRDTPREVVAACAGCGPQVHWPLGAPPSQEERAGFAADLLEQLGRRAHRARRRLDRETAATLWGEMLLFLDMVALSKEFVSPPPQVDIAWHAFILHTRDYEAYCRERYGGVIHHQPTGKPDPQAYQRAYQARSANSAPVDTRSGRCRSRSRAEAATGGGATGGGGDFGGPGGPDPGRRLRGRRARLRAGRRRRAR